MPTKLVILFPVIEILDRMSSSGSPVSTHSEPEKQAPKEIKEGENTAYNIFLLKNAFGFNFHY